MELELDVEEGVTLAIRHFRVDVEMYLKIYEEKILMPHPCDTFLLFKKKKKWMFDVEKTINFKV